MRNPILNDGLPKFQALCVAFALVALVALASASSVQSALREVAALSGRVREVLVELRGSEAMTRDTQTRAALQALGEVPQVAAAEVLDEADVRALLAPWLGTLRGEDLPESKLIRVRLKADADASAAVEAIGKTVADLPGAGLADYYRTAFPQLRAQAAQAGRRALVEAVAAVLLLWLGTVWAVRRTRIEAADRLQIYAHVGGDRVGLRRRRRQVLLRALRIGGGCGLLVAFALKAIADFSEAQRLLPLLPVLWLAPAAAVLWGERARSY